MNLWVLAPLLIAAAWHRQETDSRVREGVAKLADDSIEARENAQAELVALGEPALSELKQALSKTSNSEARGRIQSVINRIETAKRRREFKGGKPVNGLGALLEGKPDTDSDEFILRVQIVNLGTEPRDMVLIRGWDSSLPDNSYSSSSSEARVTIRQLSGEMSNSFSGVIG